LPSQVTEQPKTFWQSPTALVQERRCPQRQRTLTLQEVVDLSGAMKSGRLGAGTPAAELTAAQAGLESAGTAGARVGLSAAPAGNNAPVHRRARRTNESLFISTSNTGDRQNCLTS
jgi:hypothetical protein